WLAPAHHRLAGIGEFLEGPDERRPPEQPNVEPAPHPFGVSKPDCNPRIGEDTRLAGPGPTEKHPDVGQRCTVIAGAFLREPDLAIDNEAADEAQIRGDVTKELLLPGLIVRIVPVLQQRHAALAECCRELDVAHLRVGDDGGIATGDRPKDSSYRARLENVVVAEEPAVFPPSELHGPVVVLVDTTLLVQAHVPEGRAPSCQCFDNL